MRFPPSSITMKDPAEPSTSQASGSSEKPAHKCCLGMLYYSQAIHDRGKNPVGTHQHYSHNGDVEQTEHNAELGNVQVCAGVRSKHLTSSELAEMPPESIPSGEFKVHSTSAASANDCFITPLKLLWCLAVYVFGLQHAHRQTEAKSEAIP